MEDEFENQYKMKLMKKLSGLVPIEKMSIIDNMLTPKLIESLAGTAATAVDNGDIKIKDPDIAKNYYKIELNIQGDLIIGDQQKQHTVEDYSVNVGNLNYNNLDSFKELLSYCFDEINKSSLINKDDILEIEKEYKNEQDVGKIKEYAIKLGKWMKKNAEFLTVNAIKYIPSLLM